MSPVFAVVFYLVLCVAFFIRCRVRRVLIMEIVAVAAIGWSLATAVMAPIIAEHGLLGLKWQ